MHRRDYGEAMIRNRYTNYYQSFLFGCTTLFIIGTIIWVRGAPWNSYWWFVIGGLILLTFILPFFLKLTLRILFISSLSCLIASACTYGTSWLIISEKKNILPLPVITVKSPYPTRDKPQSKLWFANDHWWVWFPDGESSSIWRRSDSRWQREKGLDKWLKSLPGRADVWAEGNYIWAVLVAKNQMAFASLRYSSNTDTYEPNGIPVVWPIINREKLEEPIESATLARDGTGIWWIVNDYKKSIWIRHSLDSSGSQWGEPIKLGGPVVRDDISVIFAIHGSIGVMWAHQSGESEEQVYFRRHLDTNPPDKWNDIQVIAKGYEVADDHFNVAITPDSRVFVVTKDDKNIFGQAQLVLRELPVDTANTSWNHHPYANRTESIIPTRPIALLGGNPLRLYLIHSLYPQNPRGDDFIVYRSTDLTLTDIHSEDTILIPQRKGISIRNVTSTKQVLPARAPWIVLASDKFGNVYEGKIK